MTFYLGTHETSWLGRADVPVPLFVSARRLRLRRTMPKATHRWALDSGGFTELNMHGRWETTPEQYADEVNRWADEIGHLDWAAPQDWMCEPSVRDKTGKTVAEHQALTIESFLTLRELTPHVVPVLQGWELDDYHAHIDAYTAAGVDLTEHHTVGIGSVCRRGQDAEIVHVLRSLNDAGIACHGFGVRGPAYRAVWQLLASADSLAWSYNARRNQPLPGCRHRKCSNCPRWALRWRRHLLDGRQLDLFHEGAAA